MPLGFMTSNCGLEDRHDYSRYVGIAHGISIAQRITPVISRTRPSGIAAPARPKALLRAKLRIALPALPAA